MSNLTCYDFKGSAVRVILKDDEAHFVAVDVCRALGIENNRNAIAGLDADEKSTVHNPDSRPGQSGAKQFTIVSESGLFALIFKSRKPEAKAFRKWVTSEVLPSIFKTGSYAIQPVQAEVVVDHYEEENKWLINRVECAQLQVANALRNAATGRLSSQQANAVAALGGRQIELVRLQMEIMANTQSAKGASKL